jgi:hypothetical protein
MHNYCRNTERQSEGIFPDAVRAASGASEHMNDTARLDPPDCACHGVQVARTKPREKPEGSTTGTVAVESCSVPVSGVESRV